MDEDGRGFFVGSRGKGRIVARTVVCWVIREKDGLESRILTPSVKMF